MTFHSYTSSLRFSGGLRQRDLCRSTTSWLGSKSEREIVFVSKGLMVTSGNSFNCLYLLEGGNSLIYGTQVGCRVQYMSNRKLARIMSSYTTSARERMAERLKN